MATPPKMPALQNQANLLAANLVDVLPSTVKTIPVGSQNLTPAQAVTALQQGSALFTDVTNAKTPYEDAIQAKKEGIPALKQLVATIVAFLKVIIPSDTAGLTACGITGKKPAAKLTSEQQAAKAAKIRATRAANGTKGSRQKKAAANTTTTVVLGSDGRPIAGSNPLPSTGTASSAAASPGAATPAAAVQVAKS